MIKRPSWLMVLPAARMMLGRSAASQELTMVDTPWATMAIRSGGNRGVDVRMNAEYKSSRPPMLACALALDGWT